jgi:HAD superfamily hydrolase (TIGR01509 family)
MGVSKPTILFDLDGTLVDTTYLHTFSWWRALDGAGLRIPMARIHPLIGMGGSELLSTLLGADDEQISEAHGRYFAELHRYVRRLPGAAELVCHAKEDGFQTVIVTSAKSRDLDALLGALDSNDSIDEVINGEEVDQAKPAPDIFEAAKSAVGAEPATSLAVGDSVWDIEAAKRSGFRCVCLQTGGNHPQELMEHGAIAVYEDCEDLLARWDKAVAEIVDRPAS